MTPETFEIEIKDLTHKLIEMARDFSINKISDNCLYILSQINNDGSNNLNEIRKARIQSNEKKTPKRLNEITSDLFSIYSDLYDINLYVYKAKSNLTLIEIQYFRKSNLSQEYQIKVMNNKPMTHCKINIPYYAETNKEKFDINWEFGGLKHDWKMFWWKRNIRKELRKNVC
ncbi:MAG: hypothetical protein CVU05_09380 [Bacteroidetes bacterium HGW-Bacteroidetes-21]|jgi:hypothetical protein|nr:MAG: hypothetical protein CVU05_09380 [Bacteroidetes bacterium HGW-Bacteroidetes-21]